MLVLVPSCGHSVLTFSMDTTFLHKKPVQPQESILKDPASTNVSSNKTTQVNSVPPTTEIAPLKKIRFCFDTLSWAMRNPLPPGKKTEKKVKLTCYSSWCSVGNEGMTPKNHPAVSFKWIRSPFPEHAQEFDFLLGGQSFPRMVPALGFLAGGGPIDPALRPEGNPKTCRGNVLLLNPQTSRAEWLIAANVWGDFHSFHGWLEGSGNLMFMFHGGLWAPTPGGRCFSHIQI